MKIKTAIISLLFVPFLVFAQAGLPAEGLPKAGLTPESPFYFIDKLGEALREFFTFNPESKARLQITFAAERVAEIKIILETRGVEAKGLEVAQSRLQAHLASAATIVTDQKSKGKDVSTLAKELDDELETPKSALADSFKEQKRALEAKEDELKAQLKSAHRAGDTTKEATIAQELGQVKAQKELLELKEEDIEDELEAEEERIEEEIEVKEKAEKAIREAEKEKQEVLDEAVEEGVEFPANTFAEFDSLLTQAKSALAASNFVEAKNLAKRAEKSLDQIEKTIEELEKKEEAEEVTREAEEEKGADKKIEKLEKEKKEKKDREQTEVKSKFTPPPSKVLPPNLLDKLQGVWGQSEIYVFNEDTGQFRLVLGEGEGKGQNFIAFKGSTICVKGFWDKWESEPYQCYGGYIPFTLSGNTLTIQTNYTEIDWRDPVWQVTIKEGILEIIQIPINVETKRPMLDAKEKTTYKMKILVTPPASKSTEQILSQPSSSKLAQPLLPPLPPPSARRIPTVADLQGKWKDEKKFYWDTTKHQYIEQTAEQKAVEKGSVSVDFSFKFEGDQYCANFCFPFTLNGNQLTVHWSGNPFVLEVMLVDSKLEVLTADKMSKTLYKKVQE